MELVHAVPRAEQEPLVQMAPLQVSVPQHCDEVLHEPPLLTQALAPVHTPPEQVMVPQHWLDDVQRVPAFWQEPPLQTLFELQVSVPQQSPLVLQTMFTSWQGPVWEPPGIELGSTPLGQAHRHRAEPSRNDQARTRERGVIFIVYTRFGGPARSSETGKAGPGWGRPSRVIGVSSV